MNASLFDQLDAWQTGTVLVVGEAMLDCYLQGSAERLCQEAPVPVVAVSQRQDYPGGAANTAANIASLGAKAAFLSIVGMDAEGDRLRQALHQRNITTDDILLSPEWCTIAKQRVLADAHLLVRFDQGSRGINSALEQQLIQKLTARFHQVDAVLVSDYGYGLLTPKVIQTLAELQHQSPQILVIDSKQLAAYRNVKATVVKPNYSEVIQLLELPKLHHQRMEQIIPYGDRLLQLTGASIVAVTLDAEGAVVFEQGQLPLLFSTQPVPACQTAGAGDTFVSAFSLALITGASTRKAASIAMAAASLVVQEMGTTTCTLETLRQHLLSNSEHRMRLINHQSLQQKQLLTLDSLYS